MKKNHYKPGYIEICDECGKKARAETLWQDKYRYLWCVDCWPYGENWSYSGKNIKKVK